MKEKQFENSVKRFLSSLPQCYFFKTWGGGYQKSGLPDLIICYKGYFIGAELKNEIGKPSELQKYNLREIRKAGGFGYVVRPQNFNDFKKLLLELEMINEQKTKTC